MGIVKEKCKGLTDEEIVKQSLRDLDYFSCLFDRYEPKLIRYIHRVTAVDKETAEDILQDAFIKIWKNLNDFDFDMKLNSWIYRIVHNETISYWRKSKSYGKDEHISLDELILETISTEPDDTNPIFVKREQLLNTLALLPEQYTVVLVLKFLEGMRYEEISDILKIPEGTVATRINRAKKAFVKIGGNQISSFYEN